MDSYAAGYRACISDLRAMGRQDKGISDQPVRLARLSAADALEAKAPTRAPIPNFTLQAAE